MIYITWAHLDCRLSSLVDIPTWTSQVPIPGGQLSFAFRRRAHLQSHSESVAEPEREPRCPVSWSCHGSSLPPRDAQGLMLHPVGERIAQASPRSTLLELSLGTFCSLLTEAASPIAAPRPDTRALRQNEQPRPLGACWAGLPVCVHFGPSGVGPYLSKCRGCVAGAL